MEKFTEIAKIITKNRIKKIDMLSPKSTNRGNKYLDASDSLAKGSITSRHEMAQLVGIGIGSTNFNVFINRLFNKLLNSLLFLDLDERKFPSYTKAIAECYRNMYCIRLLLLLNARQSSTFIASKTIKKAIKYELTDIVLFCARYLRNHFGFIGDQKSFEYYNSIVNRYHKILSAEDASAEYLETISVMVVNSNSSQKEFAEISGNCLSKVTGLFKMYPTYQMSLNYYRIKSLAKYYQNDHAAAIKTWKEFDKLIEKYKDFDYDNRIAESELNKMDCYLQLRDFKDGSLCALNCDKHSKPYSNNWFILKECYLLLAFHTSNYEQVTNTLDLVTNNDNFKRLMINQLEKWRIFEAYHHILFKAGLTKGINYKRKHTKFNLSKFLNETPIYSKDKSGYNVSILIVQILHLMLDRNYAAITDKIDALERYSHRYLDQDKNSRANTFLKLIIEAERAEFELDKTQQKAKLLVSKLEETQFVYITTSIEGLEIIPFTELWGIVLTCLK